EARADQGARRRRGYRGGVLRSEFDFLMRRIPSGIAGTMATPDLPVQARVDLCTVCADTVRRPLNLRLRPRIRLSSQRVLFDTIKWPSITTASVPFSQTLQPAAATGARCSSSVNIHPNTI